MRTTWQFFETTKYFNHFFNPQLDYLVHLTQFCHVILEVVLVDGVVLEG